MTTTQEIIELENITRINYNDYDDNDDSSFRILDWEKGEDGLYRWNRYARDQHGTRWYGPYCLDTRSEKEIRSKLEPVAKKLGIDLGKFSGLAGINTKRLVERVATKIETKKEKTGLKGAYSREEVTVDVYQMKDGTIVHLKEPKYEF